MSQNIFAHVWQKLVHDQECFPCLCQLKVITQFFFNRLVVKWLDFHIGDVIFWRDNKDRILKMNPIKLVVEGAKGLNLRTRCTDCKCTANECLHLCFLNNRLQKRGLSCDSKCVDSASLVRLWTCFSSCMDKPQAL